MRDALYDHIERHPDEDVRVDVTRVESIDVTALNLLAAAALKVRRAGGQVVLAGARRRCAASWPTAAGAGSSGSSASDRRVSRDRPCRAGTGVTWSLSGSPHNPVTAA